MLQCVLCIKRVFVNRKTKPISMKGKERSPVTTSMQIRKTGKTGKPRKKKKNE